MAPEKGWKLVECGVTGGPDGPNYPRQIARGVGKVRVGMTLAQVQAIDRILIEAPDRTEIVTAAGKTEVRRYPDGQQIVMRDGRVTAIVR